MRHFEKAASAVVGRLTPLESDRQAEVVATAVQAASGRGSLGQVREIAGLLGLALDLRARRAGGGSPASLLRQGLALAGPVLLLVAAAIVLGAGDGWVAAAPVGLLLAGATVPVRAAGAGLALLGAATWASGGAALDPAVAAALLGAGLIVLCGTCPPLRARSLLLVSGSVVAAQAGAVVLWGAGPLSSAGIASATLVGALALLGLGWFDPRLAVVATALFVWRFAAVDLGELLAGLGALADGAAVEVIVVRWLAMAAGVLAAAAVTHRAFDRAAAL